MDFSFHPREIKTNENRELTPHTVHYTRNRNISLIPRPPYFISIFPSEDGYRSISLTHTNTHLCESEQAHTVYVCSYIFQMYSHIQMITNCSKSTSKWSLFSSYWNAVSILRYGVLLCPNTNSDTEQMNKRSSSHKHMYICISFRNDDNDNWMMVGACQCV